MCCSPISSGSTRDEDVSRVLKNLRAARLVTVTGPGGVGKTRLATEASGRLGVAAWFVPLAPVTDPADVASALLDTAAAALAGRVLDAVHALDRAALGVRRIGVNLNQAVAKLNATGQPSGDLLPYAQESIRRAARLEAAGEDLRKRFLRTIRAPGPTRPRGRTDGPESASPSADPG